MKYIAYSTASRPSLLQKTVAIVATAALVAVGLMFSAVLLVALLIVLAIGGVYVWWKTRAVRRQMKQMHEQMREFRQQGANMENETFHSAAFREETFEGEIIEGEAVRVETEKDRPH